MWKELCPKGSRVGKELGGSMRAGVHVAMSQETTLVGSKSTESEKGLGSLGVGSNLASDLHATCGEG